MRRKYYKFYETKLGIARCSFVCCLCSENVMVVVQMNVLIITCVKIKGILSSIFIAFDIINFTENGQKMLAMSFVFCVMIFTGIISTKLPYNKHTGLRLPWTVQDEDTWNIAHKVLGDISLPIALLYIACTLTIDYFEVVTFGAMLAWIGIPSFISYLYYHKKAYGL